MTAAIEQKAPAARPPVKTTLPREAHDAVRDTRGALSTFLGVFSIGLGLAEVFAPRKVAARTGVPYPALLRAYGLREIAAGIGILTSRRPGPWLQSRVAGDVMDLVTLGVAYFDGQGSGRRRAAQAAAAVAAVTALDVVAAAAHGGESA